MLKNGDVVALVVNSNGQHILEKNKIEQLKHILQTMGLIVECSPYIYRENGVFSASDSQKSEVLMKFYKDKRVKVIFDISGGDLANGVIDLLDYQTIRENPKLLFGYSDLTCLLNALYSKTQQINVLYQIKNLVNDETQQQQRCFFHSLIEGQSSLYDFDFHFIQGTQMSGIVVGGNIRCFLKLAGTKYFPDMNHKILFIESLGGESALIYSHLIHLKQLGVFEQVNGILLGTFTTMQEKKCQPTIEEMLISLVEARISIAKTEDIGHGIHSKALKIGEYIELSERMKI